MGSLSAFDSSERQTLRFGPLWVFQVIAGADKDWDQKESDALHDWIKANAPGMGEVTRESLMAIASDFQGNMEKFAIDDRTAGNGLRDCSKLLDGKSPEDEEEYENALLELGKHIASVSDAISATEQQVLDKMKEILDET